MRDHWLVRPSTLTALRIFGVIVLVLIVLAEIFVEHHPAFPIAGFGFNAWYGFASCVVLVLAAKALGTFLKRPDSYYGD